MKLAHFFIARPIFATVLSVLITLIGGISYFALPIAQYPEIAPPTVSVTASYPGASASVIADTVATPLEQEINGVEHMLYMVSQSTSDGNLTITVAFKLGTDIDDAQVQVQNRVSTAEPRVPEEVRRIGVTVRKNSPDLMMVVHLFSPDDTRDQLYVSNYASQRIVDVLKRIDGVGDVRVFGARDYSMRIWLDPDKIAMRNLTAGEVVAAIRSQNVQVASGVLNQPPVPSPGAYQMNLETLGRLDDPREFNNIVVAAGEDGRVTRLRDVARVELGALDYGLNSYLDRTPAVALGIFQRPDSNALATAEAVISAMKEMGADFPPGVAYDIIYNPTEYIQKSIDEVMITMIEAVALVVLVVILFLQTWRASIIPIVAIPISLVGTFAVLAALGYSLNTLTLFGLVLAIGIVVDDAIVVVENVERNLRLGMTPVEAARRTMNEVGSALIAIALVLVAAFVPAAFVTGIAGQFFRQFAVAITTATVISCFVSLTLSPALCAILFRAHESAEHERKGGLLRRLGAPLFLFFRGFNYVFDAIAAGYGRLASRLIVLAPVVMIAYVALLAFTIYEFNRPTGFIPDQDQGYCHGDAVAPALRWPAPTRRSGRPSTSSWKRTASPMPCPSPGWTAPPSPWPRSGSNLRHPRSIRRACRERPERQRGPWRPVAAPRCHPGGLHHHHPATAGARRRQCRGLQDDGAGPRRAGAGGAGAGRPADRGSRQRHAGPRRKFLAVQHPDTEGLCRDRSRSSRDFRPGARARVRDARGLCRVQLRERVQFPEPHLPGDGAGGGRVPHRSRIDRWSAYAQ
jgi:HAE1 family hydrophobic/amphiphilic exporter-1